jgi:Mg-chelatase subunit ChlD
MSSRFHSIAVSVLAASLFALPQVQAKTPAVVAPISAVSGNPASANLELVFVLDTTGSMGGLLEGAKTKIWGIINDIMQKRGNQNLKVKVGLVAYRDRQDAYLTKVTKLTDNLDDVYAELSSFRAQGGGDLPEDVRSAMREAIDNVGWSNPGPRTSQIIFLVGDAPPHDDYTEVPDTLASTKRARAAGMIVNTIQCGNIAATTLPWRNIAQYGGGEYFSIAQDGGVQSIATPYDVELASLGKSIGSTYLAYGSSDLRQGKQAKQAAMEM